MKRARRHVGLRVAPQPQIEREDVQHGKVLPLVFVDTFHLHVEERLRHDGDAGALSDERGEPSLVSKLHLSPLLLKLGVVGEGFELAELVESRSQPSPIRSVMSCVRPGLLRATKRRGVTPFVTLQNFSGHSSAKSQQHCLLKQLGVQLRDAVDGVAADAREMRHAHVARSALINERKPRNARCRHLERRRALHRGNGG